MEQKKLFSLSTLWVHLIIDILQLISTHFFCVLCFIIVSILVHGTILCRDCTLHAIFLSSRLKDREVL